MNNSIQGNGEGIQWMLVRIDQDEICAICGQSIHGHAYVGATERIFVHLKCLRMPEGQDGKKWLPKKK